MLPNSFSLCLVLRPDGFTWDSNLNRDKSLPIAVNGFFSGGGDSKHLGVDRVSDFVQVAVGSEKEDALVPTPEPDNFVVADKHLRGVGVI